MQKLIEKLEECSHEYGIHAGTKFVLLNDAIAIVKAHTIHPWEERVEALQRFKDYVHKRLDEAGVATHPEGEHSKHGCRIGDRLDIALKPPMNWSREKMVEVIDILRMALYNQTGWVGKAEAAMEKFMAAETGVKSSNAQEESAIAYEPAGLEAECVQPAATTTERDEPRTENATGAQENGARRSAERDECRKAFEKWYDENYMRYGLGSFKACEWVWKAAWSHN